MTLKVTVETTVSDIIMPAKPSGDSTCLEITPVLLCPARLTGPAFAKSVARRAGTCHLNDQV
jgi:hypothetical protein